MGFVRICSREGAIGQNSFRNWSEFLWEYVGLVRISLGIGGIGSNFSKNRWNWSEFLQE